MKKITLILMTVLVAVTMLVSPVQAKGEPKGAVKKDLILVGSGPEFVVVGSVILNTTASGKLIVTVNMDTEPNLTDYDVIVHVFYNPPVPPTPGHPGASYSFPDVLSTNSQGQGNATVQADINPPPENDRIWVTVAIRPSPPTTIPPTPPAYYTAPPPAMVLLK